VVNVILESTNTEVTMSGSVTGEIGISFIPQDLQAVPGEVVLTSGLGGRYPANIMVGQLTSIQQENNALFQNATVQPVVDFTNLSVVLVITNFRPLDISPLIPTSIP
jgi:rod shape-determining protein MreC